MENQEQEIWIKKLIPRTPRSCWILSSDGTTPGPPLENTSLQVSNSRRTAVISSAGESVFFGRHAITIFFLLLLLFFFFFLFLLWGDLTELGLELLALPWFLLGISPKTSFSCFISNPMNLKKPTNQQKTETLSRDQTQNLYHEMDWKDRMRYKTGDQREEIPLSLHKTRGHFPMGCLIFFNSGFFSFFIRFGLRKGANMEINTHKKNETILLATCFLCFFGINSVIVNRTFNFIN